MPQIGPVTRFAPSPTGLLHIGGARTALFNWLYAKANGGKFLLRIEDTDRARHNPVAEDSILEDLAWIGLNWDETPIRQSTRLGRHREIALQLLQSGAAYRCYSTPEDIQTHRDESKRSGVPFASPWRDADPATYPDRPYAIRLRSPGTGLTVLEDCVYGEISWRNDSLEDLVILRTDGSPTYNLAATVDDHDSGVSHVIRGDDHLANTAKQILIYTSLNWKLPIFAHVPLIHSESGKKLSKRDGAAGLSYYRHAGYHPEAVRNYLTRLGWSHGNEEFFTVEQALKWFDLRGLRKSPARLDEKKIVNLSKQHIAADSDQSLASHVSSFLGYRNNSPLSGSASSAYCRAMHCLKSGSKTLEDITAKARFLFLSRPIEYDPEAMRLIGDAQLNLIPALTRALAAANWNRDELESATRAFAEKEGMGLGKITQLLRVSLSGCKLSPSVFDMMVLLGRTESMERLEDVRKTHAISGGQN